MMKLSNALFFSMFIVILSTAVVSCKRGGPLPKVNVGDKVSSILSEGANIRLETLKIEPSDLKLINSLSSRQIDFGEITEDFSIDANVISVKQAEVSGLGVWHLSSEASQEMGSQQYERVISDEFSGVFYVEGPDWLLYVVAENGKVVRWILSDFLMDEIYSS